MAPTPLSARPLYLQLRDILADRIAGGDWKPGAAIPNEIDLAREFGVSYGTMRRALGLLENERLIARHQGRGTFVNDQSANGLADRFVGIRGLDDKPIVGDIAFTKIIPDSASTTDCERLGLKAGEKIYRIRRLRVVGEQPFMLEHVSLPMVLFPGLAEINDHRQRIVWLAQQYGLLLGRAEERVSVVGATPEVAKALCVRDGESIGELDRIVHAIDERPVEHRLAWCDLTKHYYFASMV